MKKHFLLLTLLLAFGSASMAQGVRFGLKFSPNLSWAKPDAQDTENSGSRFGYSFGLLIDVPIGSNENYAFSTGLLLNNTGGKYTAPYTYSNGDTLNPILTTEDVETTLKLRYIEVPLTIKLKTNEIGYITYFGQIGFGTAFNIRAKADVETIDASGELSLIEDEDYGDLTNLFKASLIVGGGMEFNISGDTRLMAGVQYNGGFTNALDGVKDAEGKDVKVSQNYVELSIGVYF